MSLQLAAQHLASKGRGPDTTLVHMAPSEVRGLQALAKSHGGSLTINPETGLAEAGFLKNILPMVIGAALSPFITPMGAAAVVGGLETARTGDLGKGLMAGLGAYGGAGLVSGLSSAGASAVVPETVATNTGISAAETGAGFTPYEQALGSSTQTAAPAEFMAQQPTMSSSEAMKTIGNSGNIATGQPTTFSNAYNGIGELGSETGRNAFMSGAPTGTLPAAGAALVSAVQPEPEAPAGYEPDEYDKRLAKYRLASNYQASSPVRPNPYYRPTGLGYAAEGGSTGDIMMAAGGAYEDEPMGDDVGYAAGGIAAYAPGGKIQDLPESVGVPRTGIYRDTDMDTAKKDAWTAAQIRNKKAASAANIKLASMPKTSVKGLGDVEEMAAGGSLGGYSDGGRMLKGPGDGMSDSIPATIGRKQPARLADGEFVVPADVVSHLGNGSTDAGAKKLYSMMDKIRRARTGKAKQAPAVKADKYMPV
jgi:hypothetical protein